MSLKQKKKKAIIHDHGYKSGCLGNSGSWGFSSIAGDARVDNGKEPCTLREEQETQRPLPADGGREQCCQRGAGRGKQQQERGTRV